MATVYHRYLRRGEPEPAPEPQREDADALKAKKAAADLQFVEEKKLQVIARRRETEIRNATRKRELISRSHVVKQAAFLVLSLRARLLAIPDQHARELLNVSDEREMTGRLNSIVRDALSEIAELPLRVSDEHSRPFLPGPGHASSQGWQRLNPPCSVGHASIFRIPLRSGRGLPGDMQSSMKTWTIL